MGAVTKILALCFLTVCLTVIALPRHPATGTSETCVPADDQAIRAIARQWIDFYNQGRAERVASLYSEDAYYLTQHFADGVVHPRPMVQAYVQRGVDAHYQIDSIDVLATSCSSDFAYAITRYRSTNGTQKAMGVNLVVLRKVDGGWRIVAHEAAVPDPATAMQNLTPATTR